MFLGRIFTEGEQEGGVEWKNAYLLFWDDTIAEPTENNVLLVVDNLSNAGFADTMLAAGQFAR